jgi:O-antigen/teichoic acid export membrane protein
MERSKKALINATAGIVSYAVLLISNFITRAVFVRILGLDMVGVESLFKNLITMLSLAELGLGTGIIYKLYKPIADGDSRKIKQVLNFYKKAYQIIAAVILIAGFAMAFFVHIFIKEDINSIYLGVLFFLYVADVVASYLFANRKAMIIADQNNYIVSRNDAVVSVMTMVTQVVLLILTKNFVVYACVKIICRLIGASLIGRQFRKMYPAIVMDKSQEIIDGEERHSLMKNIGALLCHRIGAFSVTATGTAIVTYFVNLVSAGIYANYTLITNTLTQVIAQIFNGITASFGNLMTTESQEKVYDRFNVLYFLNYLIYSFCTVSIFVLIQPFVKLVFGEDSLFPLPTVILLVAYFYIFGMRRVIFMTKDSAGLFRPDRYLALLEAIINLVIAIALVQKMGVDGVILASILSILLIPFWSQPYLVYKYILKHALWVYYVKYFLYMLVTLLSLFLTYWVASLIKADHILIQLFLKAIVCLLIPNGINIALFFKTKEFRSLLEMAQPFLRKLKLRG